MFCLYTHSNDPYFNLAAEEYLLTRSSDDFFMLWQSDPVVVCGKHQNLLAEINYRLLLEKNIRVARRLSGGGTVYHDSGNINFTFIKTGEAGKLVDFGSYIRPVIEFLATLGVEATEGLKHEILTDGKKISGNAEHVYRNRLLHHGTLLLNADITLLNQSLKRNSGTYTDKAVQSNRSTVTNLNNCMKKMMTSEGLSGAFYDFILRQYDASPYVLNQEEKNAVEKLAADKYTTWEWIFGWSPDYTFQNCWQSEKGYIEIHLETHRGVIRLSNIRSEQFSVFCEIINRELTGQRHDPTVIRHSFEVSGINQMLSEKEMEDLIYSFF